MLFYMTLRMLFYMTLRRNVLPNPEYSSRKLAIFA